MRVAPIRTVRAEGGESEFHSEQIPCKSKMHQFRPIPRGGFLELGIAKLLPQVVDVKRDTLQVVSLIMTGLIRVLGLVFHIGEADGGCSLAECGDGVDRSEVFGA